MADSKEKIFMQAFDDKKNINLSTLIIIGEILFGPTFADKIYVKDIFVMDTKDPYRTYFGFNTDLDLDRDRNFTPN